MFGFCCDGEQAAAAAIAVLIPQIFLILLISF
jgi:hypothetical protein